MGREEEFALKGGLSTRGVVRVGGTVRRPPSPNSDFVVRVLNHLRSRGFEGAPAAIGIDEDGRDVFSFVEGDVPRNLKAYEEAALQQAAHLIRRFHDLSAELVDTPAARAVGVEVVCHNDLSPCNFVFQDVKPIAIIDFDACAPGTRLHDLGYAAWLWLDIGSTEISGRAQTRRLTAFLEAYGSIDRSGLLAAMLRRQTILIAEGCRYGDAALIHWAQTCLAWTQQHKGALVRS